MYRSASRSPRLNIEIVLASLVTNLFGLALPLMLLHIFDRVIPRGAHETLLVFSIAGGLICLADFASRLARSHLVLDAGCRYEAETTGLALQHAFDPGVDLMHFRDEGLDARFASIGRIRQRFGNDLSMALLDLPFVVLFLAIMTLVSPVMGLTAAGVALVSLLVMAFCRHRLGNVIRLRRESDMRRRSFLVETLMGMEAVKALGIEQLMQRRYERLMSSAVPLTHHLSAMVSFTQGVAGTLSLVSPVIVAGVGALVVIHGDMTIGGLAAAVLLNARIIQPVLRIEALMSGERDLKQARGDVDALLSIPRRLSGTVPLTNVREIEVSGLSYTLEGRSEPIFEDVSFTLRKGECISIDGKDGSGRTTLLSLLAGHAIPASGKVMLNGEDLARFHPADLSVLISHITADATLLDGTLLENMSRFEPQRYREAAVRLGSEMGLGAFAASHPKGYGLPVSRNSASSLPKSLRDGALLVSGLVHGPQVVLFDEANRGLDRRVDAALVEVLRRIAPDVIMVLVTYRPSLKALAQRHYNFEGGRLIEQAPAPAVRTSA